MPGDLRRKFHLLKALYLDSAWEVAPETAWAYRPSIGIKPRQPSRPPQGGGSADPRADAAAVSPRTLVDVGAPREEFPEIDDLESIEDVNL